MHKPESESPSQASVAQQLPATGRRRLIQGGLSAGPLLLTLAGRPAYATCKQPSGFSISGNLSRPEAFACNDSKMGKKPGEWYTTGTWPCDRTNTKVSSLSGATSGSDTTTTLVSCLAPGSSRTEVEKYIIAAYLNALNNRTPSNPTEVRKMWQYRTGNYSPVPGVTWTSQQLLSYLKHTTGEF